MNIIADLLELVDEDSSVTSYDCDGPIKKITITKNLHPRFCPNCGTRLHSKGLFQRHPNHPVLQPGYELDITLVGRCWKCPNTTCGYPCTDQFNFIETGKKNTKLVKLMIVKEMKDITLSCSQIAARFNVSDTYVHNPFMQYVDLPRLRLTDAIAIDEVFLNIDNESKYAVVIMDYNTDTILDIVQSRRKETMHAYWMSMRM